MRYEEEAPHYRRDTSELVRFFEDVADLAAAAQIPESEWFQYAIKYADISSAEIFGIRSRTAASWEAFKSAVFRGYCINLDRKYSYRDFVRLVDTSEAQEIRNIDDFVAYDIQFTVIASFLQERGRIGETEQQRMYLKGINHSFRCKILARLEIKFLDHCRDDSYPIDHIHDAATFILMGYVTPTPVQAPPAVTPIAPVVSPICQQPIVVHSPPTLPTSLPHLQQSFAQFPNQSQPAPSIA